MKDLILVIDVESVGLHGPAFAVGYTLMHFNGEILFEGTHATNPNGMSPVDDLGLKWVNEHVKIDNFNHLNAFQMRRAFWDIWDKVRNEAWMAANCTWPVESNFLSACIADDPVIRMWQGPYPLLDISTISIASGRRNYRREERLPNELPEHNPLMDVRQSARLLAEMLPDFNGALDILERGL